MCPLVNVYMFLWKITIFHGEIIQLNGHGFNSYDVAMDVFDFGTVPVPVPVFLYGSAVLGPWPPENYDEPLQQGRQAASLQ